MIFKKEVKGITVWYPDGTSEDITVEPRRQGKGEYKKYRTEYPKESGPGEPLVVHSIIISEIPEA